LIAGLRNYFFVKYWRKRTSRLGYFTLVFGIMFNLKVTTSYLSNYFFCFNFVKNFSNKVIKKLITAPTAAKIIVRIKSSDRILGMILKKVPPAVPKTIDWFEVILFFCFCCYLANRRSNSASNYQVSS